MLQDFSQIRDCALAMDKPVVLGWANYYFNNQFTVYEVFRPSINYQYDNMFAVENGVLAFVIHKTLYVIPATQNILHILEKQNRFIIQDKITVPFAHGEFPIDPELSNKWVDLQKKAMRNEL